MVLVALLNENRSPKTLTSFSTPPASSIHKTGDKREVPTDRDKPTSKANELHKASTNEIRVAVRHCRKIARERAGNFYYAFMFLPEVQRMGIESVYAFFRVGDDIVDSERQLRPDEQLTILKERLDMCYEGYYVDKLTLALGKAIQRFGFERQVFDDFLQGMYMDLKIKRYATFDDLVVYCRRAAVTVGLHCLKIFDADTPQNRLYADKLGIAMQLVNIIRDVQEDYQRDRIYLPQDEMANFNVTELCLGKTEPNESVKKLLLFQSQRAFEYFAEAENIIAQNLRRKLLGARIMAAIYSCLLQKIVSSNNMFQKAKITPIEKFWIGLRLYLSKG